MQEVTILVTLGSGGKQSAMANSATRPSCTVHVLLMEHEAEVTERALGSLVPQLQADDRISLLLNGAVRPDLRERFSRLPGVCYYESASNLGVAGGRNFLFGQPESRGAAICLLLDNDAVVPRDYLDRILAFLDAHPEAGIVGPVSLVYSRVATALAEPGETFNVTLFSSDMLLTALRRADDPEWIDHLGTNTDWRNVYLRDRHTADLILTACGIIPERRFHGVLKTDPQVLVALFQGHGDTVPVSNIPGCCQVFRRALLDEIGLLEPLFNPYGWEDAEFAVRALRHGYRNLIDTSTVILHGTDQRHGERAIWQGFGSYNINQARVAALFEYLVEPDMFPLRSLERAILRHQFNRTFSPGRASEQYYLAMTGLHQAIAQLRQRFGDAVDRRLRQTLGNAGAGPLWGGTHSLLWSPSKDACDTLPGDLAALPATDADTALRQIATQREALRDHEKGVGVAPYPAAKPSAYIKPGFGVRLNRFRNLHAGKRAFIIGNGPSLNRTDLSFLWDETSFGVNGIFYMTDQTGFRPTYYCVEDNHVIEDNLERIRKYDTSFKFFPHKYRHSIPAEKNVYFLPTDWEFYHASSPHFENPRFSNDIDQNIYVGQTVTYLNMQIAFFMGFSEVYLIGVDFDYQIPPESPVEGFSILSQADDPNHFHPEYFGKGKKWHFPKLHNCLKSYEYADRHFRSHGRRIFNATVGGRLECFERIEYGSLFATSVALQAPNVPLVQMTNLILRKAIEAGETAQDMLFMAGGNPTATADVATLFARSVTAGQAGQALVVADQPPPSAPGTVSTVDAAGLENRLTIDVSFDLLVADLAVSQVPIARLAAMLPRARCAVLGGLQDDRWFVLAAALKRGRSAWVLNDGAILCDRKGHGFMGPLDPAHLRSTTAVTRCSPVTALEWVHHDGQFHRTIFCPFPLAEGVAAWMETQPTSLTKSAFGQLMTALVQRHHPFLLTNDGLYTRMGTRP